MCDDIDACSGDDAFGDTDSDGVCEDIDVCTGNDATGDTDSDGVCDDIDACAGDDSFGDTDSDGVCEDIDACTGNDATGDTDSDGVCDDIDACSGDDSFGDTDLDGVCEDIDACTGNDATGDADSDGVCDDIDACAGDDSFGDTDSDGVCEDIDVCTGNDATGDNDGDGTCDDTDPDDDNDGCNDTPDDPAPLVFSADLDGDGYGSDCDFCLGDDDSGDTDADLTCNDLDVDDDDDGCADVADSAPTVASVDGDANGQPDDCLGAFINDIDADGFADIVVGSPLGKHEVLFDADYGTAYVMYGTGFGVTTVGSQRLSQATAGVAGGAESFDEFAGGVALGDYDNDGFTDFASGAPGEDTPGVDSGYMHVLYSDGVGITGIGSDGFLEGNLMGGFTEAGDRFGDVLATGDINDDGIDDLIMAKPGQTSGSGGFNWVLGADGTSLNLASSGGCNFADPYGVGAAIAVGDFDGDGEDDVAFGAPGYESNPGVDDDTGGVMVYLTTLSGLTCGTETVLSLASGEAGAAYGTAVAAGDFNNDGFDDLAVGAPFGGGGSGIVEILLGSGSGFTATQTIDQATPLFFGALEAGDRWGGAVVASDFNGDGLDDLVIGGPGEHLGGAGSEAGIIAWYESSLTGFTATGASFYQNLGTASTSEAGDEFGAAFSSDDYNGDGFMDLAIGVPGKTCGVTADVGMLSVVYGSATGLDLADENTFIPTDMVGECDDTHRFGLVLP